MVRLFFCIYLGLFLQSCGKQKFPRYIEVDEAPQFEQEGGVFRGTFKSLHPSFRSKNSEALISIKGDQFYSRIVVRKGPRKTLIQQYIHKGARCPHSMDDMNKDGEIDLIEVFSASGEMLIPLDSHLNSQAAGRGWGPKTNSRGMYYYARSGGIRFIMPDLYQEDLIPSDGLAKLESGELLNPGGRTIILYGVFSGPPVPLACAALEEDQTYRE